MSELSQRLQRLMDARTEMMEKMLLNVRVYRDYDEKSRDSFYFGFEFQLLSSEEYCIGFRIRNLRKEKFDIKNWRFDEANVWFIQIIRKEINKLKKTLVTQPFRVSCRVI